MMEPTVRPPACHRLDVDAAALPGQAHRLLGEGFRLALMAAHDDDGGMRVVYLFTAGQPDRRVELVLRLDPADPRVPSLAASSFPAGRFEREMRDLYGIEPDGHPLPRPLVHHPQWPVDWHPMRHDAGERPRLDGARPFPFVTVQGDGVYEIPVGPVHAGLIEPGHFRFSVVGETILKLKVRLWYVHKGIERLAEGRDSADVVGLAERISGDTAVGHTWAYSSAVENALGVDLPVEILAMRSALLELERLHNHVADIGALANDVAYGIAHAHTQRIRERLLRLNQATTGHRLLRGGIFPGGAALRTVPDPAQLRAIAADLAEIVEIALGQGTVRERLTGTAALGRAAAAEIGTLGYVARASGLGLDARRDHPALDLGPTLTVPVHTTGDVLARFLVRAQEAQVSTALLRELLPGLPAQRVTRELPDAGPAAAGVGIVEGWRGTIVHRVELGAGRRVRRLKVVDPSFLNWPALPVALSATIVADFPLANKSFNLSYAANDL